MDIHRKMDKNMTNYVKEKDFCFNSRKLSRAITRLYDKFLRPSGINSTQLIVLAALALYENGYSDPINDLARKLVMERTTLSRMIFSLEKSGLVERKERLVKHRVHGSRINYIIMLSKKGKDVFEKSIPMWKKANDKFMEAVGKDSYDVYISELEVILNAAENISNNFGGKNDL